MRSIIYLFAIITGLSVSQMAEARLCSPAAVNAAQSLGVSDHCETAERCTILVWEKPQTGFISDRVTGFDLEHQTPNGGTATLFSDCSLQ